uniref:Glucagon / GIP / secretin / VIP family domain-containing protein n=1 Tax=Oryzias sinensis TaxID=183150 RepID=A0A8C7XY40_9TELE
KMKMIMWCTLLLFLCSSTKEMVLDQTKPSRGLRVEMKNKQNIFQSLKRHTDGMFTSDLTNYLDKMKAKNFVEWLAAIKQQE